MKIPIVETFNTFWGSATSVGFQYTKKCGPLDQMLMSARVWFWKGDWTLV